jgi:hypothetical protein
MSNHSSGKTLEHYEARGTAVVDRQLGIRMWFFRSDWNALAAQQPVWFSVPDSTEWDHTLQREIDAQRPALNARIAQLFRRLF